MKLSEAIREGSKGQTQTQYSYFSGDGECCALGAAGRTMGLGEKDYGRVDILDALRDVWPELMERINQPEPMATHYGEPIILQSRVKDIIVYLNDGEGWTFEQIADWLEERGY